MCDGQRDSRWRALSRGEVSLGDQLRVGVDDDVSRDAQSAASGRLPGRRASLGSRPRTDAFTQLTRELLAEWHAAVALERYGQLRASNWLPFERPQLDLTRGPPSPGTVTDRQ